MLESAVTLLPTPSSHSRLGFAWSVASDLLIAIAVVWTVPLLLGAAYFLVTRLLER